MGRPRTREVKFCKECGNEIGRNNKSFCSRACRNVYYNKHPEVVEKTCVTCGKVFMAQRKTRKYCSQKCNDAYKAQKRKEREPIRRSSIGRTEWKNRRWDILKSQNERCWLCGEIIEDKFEVHHLEYGDHSWESENVVALHCACHNQMHHITMSFDTDGLMSFKGKAFEMYKKSLKNRRK